MTSDERIKEMTREIKSNEAALNDLYEMGNNAMKARANGYFAPTFAEVVEMVYTKYFA